ncbi:glycosyltransferase family 2 protein [Empedobacter stercoris]|uniref:glycosyltransferase family 2 protein n=1 Tax=Empedobacter stercoris TaxID=1628248 RepID=UPI001CE1244C|nr:glycosyltransferase family 2 protein [Empedobacter stercoris]MCA4777332.1 glycosyltransferase family 2 protein [Empedobacter stercoris]
MNKPLISVIVPCYNQAQYMDECLQSVLDQTYQNWECIIVNDGSLDHTEQVALEWTKKDTRFIYLKKENGGVASARNLGIENARGEWIQFLDSDDIIKSTKLETIENIDNSINFIYSDFHMLENNILLPPFVNISKFQFNLNNLIKYWDDGFNVPIHCPIFNKELINNIYFINEFKLHEDWLFWVTIFAQNKIEIEYVRKPLAIYRNHGKSNTKNQLKMRDNLYAVYLYAYNYVLGTVEKELLFQSILKKYTDCKYSNSFILQQLEKINNSKYFKLRKFIYKSFKL